MSNDIYRYKSYNPILSTIFMIGIPSVAQAIYDSMHREIAKQVRAELRNAPERRLRVIVRAYEKFRKKLPWYKKYISHDFDELWMKRDLRYSVAKGLLSHGFSWEELEKKEEEERILKQIEQEKERTKQERIEKARGIELFIGNLQEYERMKGEEYEIVKVESRDSYNCVIYRDGYPDELEKLGAMNIDALIRFRQVNPFYLRDGYGIPVRKAKRN